MGTTHPPGQTLSATFGVLALTLPSPHLCGYWRYQNHSHGWFPHPCVGHKCGRLPFPAALSAPSLMGEQVQAAECTGKKMQQTLEL